MSNCSKWEQNKQQEENMFLEDMLEQIDKKARNRVEKEVVQAQKLETIEERAKNILQSKLQI